jgi:hypothetical protein
MKLLDLDCGPARQPSSNLSSEQEEQLAAELRAVGFFEIAAPEYAK